MNKPIENKKATQSNSASLAEDEADELDGLVYCFVTQTIISKLDHCNLDDTTVVVEEELALLRIGLRICSRRVGVHIADVLQDASGQLVNLLFKALLVACKNDLTDHVTHFEGLTTFDGVF